MDLGLPFHSPPLGGPCAVAMTTDGRRDALAYSARLGCPRPLGDIAALLGEQQVRDALEVCLRELHRLESSSPTVASAVYRKLR